MWLDWQLVNGYLVVTTVVQYDELTWGHCGHIAFYELHYVFDLAA